MPRRKRHVQSVEKVVAAVESVIIDVVFFPAVRARAQILFIYIAQNISRDAIQLFICNTRSAAGL